LPITDAAKLTAVKGATQVTYTHTGLEMNAKSTTDATKVATPVFYRVWAYNTVGPTLPAAITAAAATLEAKLAKGPDAPILS